MERLTRVTVIRDKKKLSQYQPGEIGQPFQQEATWYIACPECGGRASLANHEIVKNGDGTITISPSLLCPGNYDPRKCSAHYFVKNSQIQWV